MPAASQKSVIWTVIIVGVLLAVVGWFLVAGVKQDVSDIANEQDAKMNAFAENLAGALQQQSADNQVALNSVLTEIQGTAQELKNIQPPTAQELNTDELCDNIDGCNGWRLDSGFRFDSVDRAEEELTEDDNRDLFEHIKEFWDIDENEDIEDVSLHAIGRVRSNEELDTSFDFSDTMEITVVFVLEVEFYEDGSNDNTKTKYVRFDATLDDLEDGIADSEVTFTNVEPWSADKALVTN